VLLFLLSFLNRGRPRVATTEWEGDSSTEGKTRLRRGGLVYGWGDSSTVQRGRLVYGEEDSSKEGKLIYGVRDSSTEKKTR
jgi:hypothetical protein